MSTAGNTGVSCEHSEYSLNNHVVFNKPDTNNFKYYIVLTSHLYQVLWDLFLLLLYINTHTAYDCNANNNVNIKMLYKKQDVEEISWGKHSSQYTDKHKKYKKGT